MASLRHGIRLVPQLSSTVEQVLLAVGEQVGHDNISYASRMNKALGIFFKDPDSVTKLIESWLTLDEEFIQVSPLAVASTRITVSGVPPFIPNEALERELRRFGKFASGFCAVGLGCRDLKLKHVQSLRRQLFMFLDAASQTLDVLLTYTTLHCTHHILTVNTLQHTHESVVSRPGNTQTSPTDTDPHSEDLETHRHQLE